MTGRGISATNTTALAGAGTGVVIFVEMEFPSGTVRAHSVTGEYEWGGNTWDGVGDLGTVSSITESNEPRPHQVVIGLSGVNTTFVSDIQDDEIQKSTVRIWYGVIDDENALVDDPFIVWGPGRVSTSEIMLGEETAGIEITCENRLIGFHRVNGTRYTNTDQQRRYPGDLFLEYAALLADNNIRWGGRRSLRGEGDFRFDGQDRVGLR